MSSHMVSKECMNTIVNGLFWNQDFTRMNRSTLENAGYVNSEDFGKLGADFMELNKMAVDHRYKDDFSIETFEWVSDKPKNVYQVLKSMKCLKYQCNEGIIPEMKLFKLLDTLILYWTDMVLGQIKEFEDATWGIQ